MSTTTDTTTFDGPLTSALERRLRNTLVDSLVPAGAPWESTFVPDGYELLGIDVERLRDLLGLEEQAPPGRAADGCAGAAAPAQPERGGTGAPTAPHTPQACDAPAESASRDGTPRDAGWEHVPGHEKDSSGLYKELRELEAESARIELRRAEVLGRLIAAQTAADLAGEPEAGPGRRREVAAQARSAVVDSAVASCGGRRGP